MNKWIRIEVGDFSLDPVPVVVLDWVERARSGWRSSPGKAAFILCLNLYETALV